jgi:hypothetical protein
MPRSAEHHDGRAARRARLAVPVWPRGQRRHTATSPRGRIDAGAGGGRPDVLNAVAEDVVGRPRALGPLDLLATAPVTPA